MITLTEPHPPELEPFGEAVACGTCGGPIVNSVLGWLHVTEHGVPATGWLCPLPHMHLAEPDFLAAPDAPADRDTAPAPPPRRMPTPIPPRKNVGRAESSPQAAPPAQWPPLEGGQWWQPQ